MGFDPWVSEWGNPVEVLLLLLRNATLRAGSMPEAASPRAVRSTVGLINYLSLNT
jgi:hypothetical protein